MLNHTLHEQGNLLKDTLENQLVRILTLLKDKIIARGIINDINPGTPNQKKSKTILYFIIKNFYPHYMWGFFLPQI